MAKTVAGAETELQLQRPHHIPVSQRPSRAEEADLEKVFHSGC